MVKYVVDVKGEYVHRLLGFNKYTLSNKGDVEYKLQVTYGEDAESYVNVVTYSEKKYMDKVFDEMLEFIESDKRIYKCPTEEELIAREEEVDSIDTGAIII